MTASSEPDQTEERVPSVIAQLRHGGLVSDADFDLLVPSHWRAMSARYWTPVPVARRVAEWFAERGGRRVLDIGAGIGKFCVVGAAATELEFLGIEQRPHLVDAANELAARVSLDHRARVVHATLESFDASSFDCLYLYNPFAENLYSPDSWFDATLPLTADRFQADIDRLERLLGRAAVGTRLITYYGYGGRVPNSFTPVRVAMIADDTIRLWEKRRTESSGYFVEQGSTGMELFHERSRSL